MSWITRKDLSGFRITPHTTLNEYNRIDSPPSTSPEPFGSMCSLDTTFEAMDYFRKSPDNLPTEELSLFSPNEQLPDCTDNGTDDCFWAFTENACNTSSHLNTSEGELSSNIGKPKTCYSVNVLTAEDFNLNDEKQEQTNFQEDLQEIELSDSNQLAVSPNLQVNFTNKFTLNGSNSTNKQTLTDCQPGSSSTIVSPTPEVEENRWVMIECHWLRCGKLFETDAEFFTHIKKHCVGRRVNRFCLWEGCSHTSPFNSIELLEGHVWTHTNYKIIQCDKPGCNKTFLFKKKIRYHNCAYTRQLCADKEDIANSNTCSQYLPHTEHENHSNSEGKRYKCDAFGCMKSYKSFAPFEKHLKTCLWKRMYNSRKEREESDVNNSIEMQ
ncbi:Protein CBG07474 [Caenorhabditis briggsae]|uniref:Protein CBG07474 n=2 Tax=Caenorhabditis briggsae TaxID=6238 RepID=A8X4P9_CAEBR|nr:Protein CBG07474 [Caenorhabditis briggsae]ULT84737.1 hypothetical protein L3Y34_013421 [Caenorhabditis briggsae]CAP27609.1 Protein CBG07474 [Caenorhabditis briggsae]